MKLDQVLPPAFLRKRIHGARISTHSSRSGRAVASDLIGYLGRVQALGPEFRVLDFGVGCARVMKPLLELAARRFRAERSSGTDGTSTHRRSNGARRSWARGGPSPSTRRCRPCRTPTAFSTSSIRSRSSPICPRRCSSPGSRKSTGCMKAGRRSGHFHPFLRTAAQAEGGKADRARLSPWRRQGRRRPAGFLSDFVPHPRVYRAGMGESYRCGKLRREGRQQGPEPGAVREAWVTISR